ncbi:dTMP kinase [Alicyclobacillus acidiphilus]|jgi:dTMP kinase|uniref:dTMP kinase n=1 Tax=Alicyclobacillus acidiphilus TaxID=182455 RepID=UPI000A43EBF9|nr:dTMP kinase [Alicyclobacillus acidiphilus]
MTLGKGIFITFEGIDGAGKTTQILRLSRWLEGQGLHVARTREPGGTAIGDAVRSILLNPAYDDMSPRAEVLLYAASRAQLVDRVIRPALAEGKVVLCDRFVDASIAYQGAGLQLGPELVAQVNAFALDGLRPDITILFDLDWASARDRLVRSRGGGQLDRIEQRDDEFFHRVQSAFREIANRELERVKIVDAAQDPDAIEQEIRDIIWKYIRQS